MARFTLLLFGLLTGLLAPGGVAAQSIEYLVMPGDVIAGHADLEGECSKCHVPFDHDAQPALCMDCHDKVRADVRTQAGFHGRIEQTICSDCHTEHKGRNAVIVVLDEMAFDHSMSDFVLRGAHSEQACADCHQPDARHRDAPGQCVGCHREDDVHRRQLGEQCADCHNETDWRNALFDHDTTAFVLDTGHAEVACTACHADHRYARTPQQCIACHRDDDAHRGDFGERCQGCHLASRWSEIVFDHDRDTDFLLRDRHASVACGSCHLDPLAAATTPTSCEGCHRDDDVHDGQLGQRCESCHSESGWWRVHLRHDFDTRFELRGRHRAVSCASCHRSAYFRVQTPTRCQACHLDDDVHEGALGERCDDCHAEQTWVDTVFDHDRQTRFALRGAHGDVRCDSCHEEAHFREPPPRTCYGCHAVDDRERGHRGRFGRKCESCHVERVWDRIRFDHARDTRFALLGRHRPLACGDCHVGDLYRDKLEQRCVACHDDDDRHEAQLGDACGDCHAADSWSETRFNHADSRFPLAGEHLGVGCEGCHASARFKDTSTACLSCHEDDDVHRQRLGPRCDQCHVAGGWQRWRFDHSRTAFPLQDAHADTPCEACHTTPVMGRMVLGGDCIDCHAGDDVHFGSLTTQCGRCHGPSNWRDVDEQGREWGRRGGPPDATGGVQ